MSSGVPPFCTADRGRAGTLDSFNYKVERTIETSGSRGNIYDCNGKLLAYNQLAYSVTLESTDKTEELARERSKEENRDVSENEIRNEVIYNLIELLESNGDEIQYDLPLEINGKGNLTFTESEVLSGASNRIYME